MHGLAWSPRAACAWSPALAAELGAELTASSATDLIDAPAPRARGMSLTERSFTRHVGAG
ncbi:MAG: hypothetical protein KIT84_15675 [Labilithrix sp.]|nr:hypothetical protein [Labilithrix sp.]MCW5812466.1 hypothetical protein [Labilithrix sp.]